MRGQQLYRDTCANKVLNLSHAGVMVAWAGIEHYNRGMTQPPPPIDETSDCWVCFKFNVGVGFIITLSYVFAYCHDSLSCLSPMKEFQGWVWTTSTIIMT